MNETPEDRLKRLKMRAWRRGTKEMDLILGPYCDAQLSHLVPEGLDALESAMDESDQDLYAWISGAMPIPPQHQEVIENLTAFLKGGRQN